MRRWRGKPRRARSRRVGPACQTTTTRLLPPATAGPIDCRSTLQPARRHADPVRRPRPCPDCRRQRRRPVVPTLAALAQHAEQLGFSRYWLAEHHGMPGIASAATAVLIGHVGARHLDHPRRRRRRHAAQPFAAGDRRAVRHARVALPRPHRPRPGPRAGLRPGAPRGRCGATSQSDADQFPQDVVELMDFMSEAAAPAGARGAGPRARGAGLDPRLEPVRRAAGGAPRACPMPSPRTSRRADDAGDRASTARPSSRRRSWPSRT